ncbi:MAG TPA: hypothetical protein VK607_23320, partial [Kofleriaceae bacterium]|nr:hypothetical protein [Kofleriaceae bacterium]
RVGAEAILPGDSLLPDRPASPQTTTPGVGLDAVWSKINAPRPTAPPAAEPRPRSGSHPPPTALDPARSSPGAQPPYLPSPSGSTPGAQPLSHRPRSPSGPMPGASSDGLRAPAQSFPHTRLGMVAPTRPSATRPAHAARAARAWLAIAALLVIAGGVALAIALTGS